MIRIDYKYNGDFVNTTWVKEEPDKHSNMGRLVFSKEDFDNIRYALEAMDTGQRTSFEEKKEG